MRIIEFLLNNIFIVVIIIGALASLFGKSGSKRKPSQMPDFGGGGLPRMQTPRALERDRGDERPQPEQTQAQTVYYPAAELREDVRPESSASYRESSQAHAAGLGRTLQSVAANKTKAATVEQSRRGSKSAIAASLQAEDLRKAVVWAEILGPPRAKRHYRK